jgi:beta-barrel assembly-enhancing protease
MKCKASIGAVALLLAGGTLQAQVPGGVRDRIGGIAGKVREIRISEEEEIRLGEDISSRIRARYGVVQDAAVHKYVSLVGTVVARKSARNTLTYRFIVLDTDGVNAFAAPGGFIHITRGTLALMKSEAELAGVLAHEVAHIAGRHTIRAVQKGKVAQMAAEQGSISSNPELFRRFTDECYKAVFAGFGRADEMEADDHGLAFTAAAGYDAAGLMQFLTALQQRNASSGEKQGLFSSHPEMTDRLRKLQGSIEAHRFRGGAVLRDRFVKHVRFQPVGLTRIVAAEAGSAGLAGGDEKKTEPEDKKKSRFSLGRLRNPLGTGGQTKQSGAVTGSGGSRGVDQERMAKGGPNRSAVPVTVTENDIRAFRAEGKLTG